MTKPKLVIGNLKMNLETRDARDSYLEKAKKAFEVLTENERNAIAICPPMLHVEAFIDALDKQQIAIGAQNAHHELRGKFTGETSPKTLFSLGVSVVLLGHSERRAAGETQEIVITKLIKALEVGLTPVICIGYGVQSEDAEQSIKEEVEKITKDLTQEQIEKTIIAYEPIWAIGTGKTPSPEHIHTVTLVIKKVIASVYGRESESTLILYGGSVTTENIRTICEEGHIDGVLVGGASLQPENLALMSKIINNN